MNLSITSNTGRPVVVPNNSADTTAIGRQTIKVAVMRPKRSLSCTAAMITYTMEIIEVTPANTTEPKNSKPISGPNGA